MKIIFALLASLCITGCAQLNAASQQANGVVNTVGGAFSNISTAAGSAYTPKANPN